MARGSSLFPLFFAANYQPSTSLRRGDPGALELGERQNGGRRSLGLLPVVKRASAVGAASHGGKLQQTPETTRSTWPPRYHMDRCLSI